MDPFETILAAIRDLRAEVQKAFDENKHPRADDGKWTSGSGSHDKPEKDSDGMPIMPKPAAFPHSLTGDTTQKIAVLHAASDRAGKGDISTDDLRRLFGELDKVKGDEALKIAESFKLPVKTPKEAKARVQALIADRLDGAVRAFYARHGGATF